MSLPLPPPICLLLVKSVLFYLPSLHPFIEYLFLLYMIPLIYGPLFYPLLAELTWHLDPPCNL